VVLFNEGADDFLMELNRARKTDGFTGQSLEPRAECQVVAFDKALFPKSTIKPQLPQPQVTVTLGAF
jgi:hypothetical protein